MLKWTGTKAMLKVTSCLLLLCALGRPGRLWAEADLDDPAPDSATAAANADFQPSDALYAPEEMTATSQAAGARIGWPGRLARLRITAKPGSRPATSGMGAGFWRAQKFSWMASS